MAEICPSTNAMMLMLKRIRKASPNAMTTHLRLIRHCISLPNKERKPDLPFDKAVMRMAMTAGMKTITTGASSRGRGHSATTKVRAMVNTQKIKSACRSINAAWVIISFSYWQEV